MEEQFDLMWIEEPARALGWDFLGLRRHLRRCPNPCLRPVRTSTPWGDFLPLLPQPGPPTSFKSAPDMTGITCALQLADAAYGFNLPVTLGGSAGHHHAHLATVIPNYITIEVGNPESDDGVTTHDVAFENGKGHTR